MDWPMIYTLLPQWIERTTTTAPQIVFTSPPTLPQILRAAYELIKDPDRWIAGTLAVSGKGIHVHPEDPRAERFCAAGALVRVTKIDSLDMSQAFHYLNKLVEQLFPHIKSGTIMEVNDQLGHAAVMQVFEKALVELEGSL